MQNFENKMKILKKLWVISGGIFDQQKVEAKLKDLEKTLAQENFWKDKNLVKKKLNKKKIWRYFKILSKIFKRYK